MDLKKLVQEKEYDLEISDQLKKKNKIEYCLILKKKFFEKLSWGREVNFKDYNYLNI